MTENPPTGLNDFTRDLPTLTPFTLGRGAILMSFICIVQSGPYFDFKYWGCATAATINPPICPHELR